MLCGQCIYAQSYSLTSTNLGGVYYSAMAFADIDGDNDQDVLITGVSNDFSIGKSSKLYENDGLGNYTEVVGTPFDQVAFSAVAFADVNGDGYPDVLITGLNDDFAKIASLYLNNGSGNFTEVSDTPFIGVEQGAVAFADVDGDDDQDVIIAGEVGSAGHSTQLYLNDGAGVFTQVEETPFDEVLNCSIAFADIDGDNDNDVLITGRNISFVSTAKLYSNDGSGIFTEVVDTPFAGVVQSSIAFADVDNDNDQDLLITGTHLGDKIAKLYVNDGTGTFSEMQGTPFEGIFNGSIAISDLDNDNDMDVFICGKNANFDLIAKIYNNDGQGNFAELVDMPFEGTEDGEIGIADVDGDNDQDILITGNDDSNDGIAQLYLNDLLSSNVDRTLSSFEYTLFPNPSISGKLFLNYQAKYNHTIEANIYDLRGVLLAHQKVHTIVGEQQISIDISKLDKGTFIIQLSDGVSQSTFEFVVH